MTNCLTGQNNNSETPINALVEDNFTAVYHHWKAATFPAVAIAPDSLGVYPTLAYISFDSVCDNPTVFRHHWEAATLPAFAIAQSLRRCRTHQHCGSWH